jgi:hypothetical protein
MGLVTFHFAAPEYREQIGIQLSSPLVIGQKYFLSFYTVLGLDILLGGNYYTMPSNNIGLRLSTVPYNPSNPAPIDNYSHLRSSFIINDTLNWTRISGNIVADSAYQYLIIGNFYDDVNTDTLHWNCGSCLNAFGYYLVDDVCISTDSLLANGGIDALSCTVSVPETADGEVINLFPNPTSDVLNIKLKNISEGDIILYDLFGRIVYTDKLRGDDTRLNLSSFPCGTYILKIASKNSSNSYVKKIIKL